MLYEVLLGLVPGRTLFPLKMQDGTRLPLRVDEQGSMFVLPTGRAVGRRNWTSPVRR